jgi:hypothetical protein
MKKQTFHQKLVELLSDSEVQRQSDCHEMLLDAKERLEKGKPEWMVASRLSESLSLFSGSYL